MKTKALLPLLIVLLALLVFQRADAQLGTGNIQTQTDITGSGATVPVCSTCGYAQWVQITTPSANAAAVRWGDSSTSSTRGAAIEAGGGQYLPKTAGPYYLPQLYVYIASSDKVSVTWGY